jgi:hypothetical protein
MAKSKGFPPKKGTKPAPKPPASKRTPQGGRDFRGLKNGVKDAGPSPIKRAMGIGSMGEPC